MHSQCSTPGRFLPSRSAYTPGSAPAHNSTAILRLVIKVRSSEVVLMRMRGPFLRCGLVGAVGICLGRLLPVCGARKRGSGPKTRWVLPGQLERSVCVREQHKRWCLLLHSSKYGTTAG